jgi:gliding motility-associated-like protein
MAVTTDTICVGEIATLTASGATNYHWSDNQLTASINVSPGVTTPYSVTGTSLWGCKDSAQTQVVVYNNPVITVTPSVICSGDSARAFAPNALSYSWDNGLGSDTIVSPIITAQQTYMLTVIVPGGCRDSATLIVNPNPIVTCSATEICAGQTSIVTASGANTYNWSNFQSGATISVSPMSNMVLSVDGTDLNGCKGSSQTTVVVHPTPVSSFNPNETLVTIEEGDITFIDNSTDATIWYYNFGEYSNDLNTSSEQNPTHKYLHTGYFQVWQVVSTEFGCMDSSYTRVQVEAPYFFYVPSAFTPDHDGKNELFCPSGKGIDVTSYSMEIYNRWGALVFHTNVPLGCWDGMIDGTRAPQGSYIYKINLKDEEAKHHDYMGDFIILR